MIPFLDKNLRPLKPGYHLEVKYCCGRYGQTRTVRGILEQMDQYGGIYLTLDQGCDFLDDRGRFGTHKVSGGDRFYVCNAFSFNHSLNARVGEGEHDDYEHGHSYYCLILDPDAPAFGL